MYATHSTGREKCEFVSEFVRAARACEAGRKVASEAGTKGESERASGRCYRRERGRGRGRGKGRGERMGWERDRERDEQDTHTNTHTLCMCVDLCLYVSVHMDMYERDLLVNKESEAN